MFELGFSCFLETQTSGRPLAALSQKQRKDRLDQAFQHSILFHSRVFLRFCLFQPNLPQPKQKAKAWLLNPQQDNCSTAIRQAIREAFIRILSSLGSSPALPLLERGPIQSGRAPSAEEQSNLCKLTLGTNTYSFGVGTAGTPGLPGPR